MQKARAGHRFYDRSVDSLECEATDEPLAIRTTICHETFARITLIRHALAAKCEF